MKTASLATLKVKMTEACAKLRPFTLGRAGVTQKDGIEGIRRINAICKQLKKLFGDGPEAVQAAQIATSGRGCVMAAEARLGVLGYELLPSGEIS